MSTAEVEKPSRKRASNPNRGSKPGERRGGRKKGTPNKATRDIKEAARQYTDRALLTLVTIMEGGENVPAAAMVSACREILDRAYGKPTQSMEHSSPDGSMSPPAVTDFMRGLREALQDRK